MTAAAAQGEPAPDEAIFVVRDLSVSFPIHAGLINFGPPRLLRAVQEASIKVRRGTCCAIVGESGSGKTTLARTLAGLVRPSAGQVLFDGLSVGELDNRAVRRMRRRVQMVMQDPRAALDPRQRVGEVLREALVVHRISRDRADQQRRIEAVIQQVGLSVVHLDRYANQLSGGQRQRVAIARAIIVEPQALILDEPVSALDVSIQAQIVNLLIELQEQFHLTYVLITHDLSLVGHIADDVAVMYLGRLVEQGLASEVIGEPAHPYTASLLSAVPGEDPEAEKAREVSLLEGNIPSPLALPGGCAFHTRCPHARQLARGLGRDRVVTVDGNDVPRICAEVAPPEQHFGAAGGHRANCHFPLRPAS
ncbi:MAG: ABC transporter ATP-binding protein [Acetobacteraceae bacterium]|nr:ABC transporter ATP-binding protein [Acetobacteraceae bacterium]